MPRYISRIVLDDLGSLGAAALTWQGHGNTGFYLTTSLDLPQLRVSAFGQNVQMWQTNGTYIYKPLFMEGNNIGGLGDANSDDDAVSRGYAKSTIGKGCEVSNGTGTTVANTTFVPLNTGGSGNTVKNNHPGMTVASDGITVDGATYPGWYAVATTAFYSGVGSGNRIILEFVNVNAFGGSATKGRSDQMNSNTTNAQISASALFYLESSTTIKAQAWHSSGASRSVSLPALSVVQFGMAA